MTIDSKDTLFYTAVFLLPGFIINSIIDQTNPPKKHNDAIFFLKCVALSIVNCAVWSWLYLIIIECRNMHTVLRWVLLTGISILGSTIIGVVLAVIKQHQLIDRLLLRFKVKTIHNTPTAWDYVFAQQKSGFVVITLIDDKQLYGWYSVNSFTSSDPDERDIFVEKAYTFREGQWIIDEQGDGFYIPKDQIKVIEFKKGGCSNAG